MTCRHWKQQFDAEADLVFRRRMKMCCCGVDTVQAGDPVTEEMKQLFGKHRLKIWWRGNFIELAPEKVGSKMSHCGGGYYDVPLSDGTMKRVRGKAKAQFLLSQQV